MNTIGIVQPGRLGDIINLLPAMKVLQERHGANIIWPIFESFIYMFTDVIDFIHFIPVTSNVYQCVPQAYHLLKNIYKCDQIYDIAATFPDSTSTDEYIRSGGGKTPDPLKHSNETYDMFKYRLLDVPIEVKWNLKDVLKRNHLQEKKVYDEYVTHEKYAIAFLKSSSGDCNLRIDPKDRQIIYANEKHSLFHWIETMEKAESIIAVNSAPMVLTENLNLTCRKIGLKYPPSGIYPLLRNKWEFRSCPAC